MTAFPSPQAPQKLEFWLRKNPGCTILAADETWECYFGCRKTLGALFWLRKLGGRYFGWRKNLPGRTFSKSDEKPSIFDT